MYGIIVNGYSYIGYISVKLIELFGRCKMNIINGKSECFDKFQNLDKSWNLKDSWYILSFLCVKK